MKIIKKLFGEIDLTWKKVIIFAILAGVYTAIMAILPVVQNTSFSDITVTFEVWILFGIIIIMNSKSARDSALKCFVFFLISQPLVYLLQVPFASMGWGLFGYYRYWFIWTLFTLPMGFLGYYMKKDKWWGLVILTPMLIFLGTHYMKFLNNTQYDFPHHLLSTLFCLITLLIYPICIFNNKKVKTAGIIISIVIILSATAITLLNQNGYNTTILINGGEKGASFDDTYNVYLEDPSYGKVYIIKDQNLDDYMINAEFKKTGKTNVIIEDLDGNKEIFEIDIKNNSFEINKKE